MVHRVACRGREKDSLDTRPAAIDDTRPPTMGPFAAQIENSVHVLYLACHTETQLVWVVATLKKIEVKSYYSIYSL